MQRHTFYKRFVWQIEHLQYENQALVEIGLSFWRKSPLAFWRRIDPLCCSRSPFTAIPRLWNSIDTIEGHTARSLMQRRLCLVLLDTLHQGIKNRIKQMIRESRLDLSKSTCKSVASSVLCQLICKSKDCNLKGKVEARLRAGERYGQLRDGVPLALWDMAFDGL